MMNTDDSRAIEATDLQDGEHIILAEGAEIEFLVGQDTRAKIKGKAEFELQDL